MSVTRALWTSKIGTWGPSQAAKESHCTSGLISEWNLKTEHPLGGEGAVSLTDIRFQMESMGGQEGRELGSQSFGRMKTWAPKCRFCIPYTAAPEPQPPFPSKFNAEASRISLNSHSHVCDQESAEYGQWTESVPLHVFTKFYCNMTSFMYILSGYLCAAKAERSDYNRDLLASKPELSGPLQKTCADPCS